MSIILDTNSGSSNLKLLKTNSDDQVVLNDFDQQLKNLNFLTQNLNWWKFPEYASIRKPLSEWMIESTSLHLLIPKSWQRNYLILPTITYQNIENKAIVSFRKNIDDHIQENCHCEIMDPIYAQC